METVYLVIICVLVLVCAALACALIAFRDIIKQGRKTRNVIICIDGNDIVMRLTENEFRVVSDIIAQYTYQHDDDTIFIKQEK